MNPSSQRAVPGTLNEFRTPHSTLFGEKQANSIDTRGRLARKHFSTGAHPYIAAASVSARGDAQCVWSHESSISSSYFHLELRRAISHESGLRKPHCSRLLRASCSLQAAARCCTQVLCASCSAQALCACALCKLLCASALSKLLCASCSAPVAPCKRFAHVLCASWSVQVAMCSEQVALRKFSAPVAPRKRFAHVLCASWSAQVALRQLLRASALRMCFVQVALRKCSEQVALRKLLCARDSAQVALRKCCRSCGNVLRVLFVYLKVAIFQPELRGCAPRTTFVLKSCDFPA